MLAVGFVVVPVARPATLVELKVDSITGSGSFSSKAAIIHEGDSVTVGIYLSNFEDSAGNSNGLGAYFASIRSFSELFDVPSSLTSFAGGPTATTTVLNATTSALTTPAQFELVPTQGAATVQDLTAGTDDPDPNDTDLDIKKMGVSQDVASSGPFFLGYGTGATPIELGKATFTALDLADGAFPFNRTVHLNTYYTNPTGVNFGLIMDSLTDDTANSNSLSSNKASAEIIGADVIITVSPVPEPTTLVLGLSACVGLWTLAAANQSDSVPRAELVVGLRRSSLGDVRRRRRR